MRQAEFGMEGNLFTADSTRDKLAVSHKLESRYEILDNLVFEKLKLGPKSAFVKKEIQMSLWSTL